MTIPEFKTDRPDLVELFEGMNHEELLEQCYKESFDAVQMQKRVAVFMELCTNNMSRTDYTEASIRSLVTEAQDSAIMEFCYETVLAEEEDVDIANAIRNKATEL